MRTFYVGAKAVIARDGGVLLLHEARRDAWDLPGGRVERHETLHQALRRELCEELPGVSDVDIGAQLGAAIVAGIEGDPGLLLVLYEVRARLPAVVRTSGAHRGHAWVPMTELRERLPPELVSLLAPRVERWATES